MAGERQTGKAPLCLAAPPQDKLFHISPATTFYAGVREVLKLRAAAQGAGRQAAAFGLGKSGG